MLTLNPATTDDADRLADLRVKAMRPSLQAAGRFTPTRARRRFLDGFVASDTMIAISDGRVIGFYVLRRRAGHLKLDHLYVDPAHHGKGWGGQLLTSVMTQAQKLGLPIRLLALNGSPANAFCRRYGFLVAGKDSLDTWYEWAPVKRPAQDGPALASRK